MVFQRKTSILLCDLRLLLECYVLKHFVFNVNENCPGQEPNLGSIPDLDTFRSRVKWFTCRELAREPFGRRAISVSLPNRAVRAERHGSRNAVL